MKKKIIGIIVCMLLMVTSFSISGKYLEQPTDSKDYGGSSIFGFIMGQYDFLICDEDLLGINIAFPNPAWFNFRCRTLFHKFSVHHGMLLWLSKYNNCLFLKNFVVGFCKIYIPDSEIKMQVVSHDDEENKVCFEVTEIIGDKIWERNLGLHIYNESAGLSSFQYGPTHEEFLSVGDRINVTTFVDGYFRVQINEKVSRKVVYESELIKF